MATIVGVLSRLADERPTDRAFVFLDEHEHAVTYAELDSAARRVAAALSARGAAGQPVLLLYPPGRAYVEGFLGCLYAGAIAVPAYPPDPSRLARTLPRLRALTADCGAKLALSVSGLAAAMAAQAPELGAMDWISTDTLPEDASWAAPGPRPDSLALLQYTSGSTGAPKGVLLSHANLMHNAELVHLGFGTSPNDVGVSWLPPYHDMGLIGGIVQPIYAGLPIVLMSPLTFLQRPMTWLETISRFGGTVSGGPNFAFDLCVRKSTPRQRAELDLSRWAVAFCGAEPVRAQTMDRFAEAFEPAGFRREAFYPCYGLAEGTLIVTGGRRGTPPRLIHHDGAVHVGCGTALGDQRVAVVDPDSGTPCAPGEVGEIWVSGPSVARGYWNRPGEPFHARLADDPDRRYLRTGDLGLLDPTGELVVTGRAKDLIIIRGRNVYPQDLEHAVEQHVAAARPGCAAAFPVDVDGEERVAIACEVSDAAPHTIAAIRQVLAETHEISPASVVLLRPRSIPKTSSGKIQRHACRQAFLAGELDVLARWDAGLGAGSADAEPAGLVGLLAGTLGLAPDEVPPDEPLSRLGLDSLRAMELRHTLQDRLGLDVSLSELLSGITANQLAERPAPAAPKAADVTSVASNETNVTSAPFGERVSDGQRALWFLQRWAPESTAYHITRAAMIRSPLDVEALERAFRALVERHPALRTSLPSVRGEPVPRLIDWDGPVLERHDVARLGDEQLRQRLELDARRPFDLERGPLLRVSLYSCAPAEHVLLLSVHHVIADFWSLSVLADDLLTLYAAELRGEQPRLAELAAPATTEIPDVEARLAYWRRKLAGAPPALELPTSAPRPRLQSFRGASHEFQVEPRTVRQLDDLARQAGATRFVTLLAAFAALLARYAGDDVVIGTPTAGRDDRRSAGAVGYFVNPVPLRVRVRPDASMRELVAQVRGTVLDALDHAVPFPRLVEAIRPVRDPGRPPVVQVMLTLQQAPPGRPDLAAFAVADEKARVRLGELDVRPYRLATDGAAFDLSLMLAEVAGGLTGSLEYSTDLFDRQSVARLGRQLCLLLEQAVSRPDAPLDTLDLMDGAERAAVLALADGGDAPAQHDDTLYGVFARQAARRPDAVAVAANGQVLTYGQLDGRANALASVLRGEFGVRRGALVGVHAPRGPDAMVAFWAVLKAGGVYLPLEVTLPPRRLAWMIDDARPLAVLTDRSIAGRLPADGPSRIFLDEDWPDHAGVDAGTGPDDLAYVIYTSGSTGRPKAVLVRHRGAVNVARAEATALGVTESGRVLQYASYAYDVSIVEVLVAHLHGAELHLAPPQAPAPGPELVRLLAERRITAATFSPSTLAALPDAELPDLTGLVAGGETCPAEVVERWGRGRRFLNAYGPTETAISATMSVCEADCEPGRPRPTIGRPLPNVRTYVLDHRMRPVPVGMPGELYIGGVGVGEGYLGRPELTAERFVPDPFGPTGGARLYRTGDRARWLPAGELDFLGRLDEQVKIRGIRVEPGEIEARLRELAKVREVAVVPRPGPSGGTELVAYLVMPEPRPAVAQLRGLLRAELPEPLVPAAFVYLDRLPLNASDKLDRAALPPPTPADRGVSERLAPRTELERAVARVWADVLGTAVVGVRDHFFDELGGTSLLVAKVASELSERLGLDVPVTHLFEHPTVEALARRLDQRDAPADGSAPEDHATARRRALARRSRKQERGLADDGADG